MPKKAIKKVTRKAKPKTSVEKVTLPIDLLDIEALRIDKGTQDIEANLEGKYAIEVCKPDSLEYIQVTNNPDWQIAVSLIEYKPKQEYWIVMPEIANSASKDSEIAGYQLHLAITEYGRLFIWPAKKGRGSWNESRRIAVNNATNGWVRVKGNFEKKQYFTIEAGEDIATAQWPDLTLQEIVSIAFGDRIIKDHNHFLLRKLQGKSC